MSSAPPIYLATVALDRNRWGSRIPSLRVSDWLVRLRADGFDGIELWEVHYIAADESEQARLIDAAAPVAIYNTYTGFSDSEEDVAARQVAAEAIARLRARGVKYNLGRDAGRIDEYRRNLLAWAGQLPPACQLLCECHPGTVLEQVDAAAAFFADLDPARFAMIAHLSSDAAALQQWLEAFGPRVRHLHLQLRRAEDAPSTPEGHQRLTACVAVLRDAGFTGSASIEFTRGIGREEQAEILYANALSDMAAYRNAWK